MMRALSGAGILRAPVHPVIEVGRPDIFDGEVEVDFNRKQPIGSSQIAKSIREAQTFNGFCINDDEYDYDDSSYYY